MDGNRTHQSRREPGLNGFEGRGTPDVSNAETSTSDVAANLIHQECHQDGPELAEIAAAWPLLPAPIRAGVLALVRTAIEQPGGTCEQDVAQSQYSELREGEHAV